MEVKSENVILEDEQRLKGIDLSWFPFAARKYHVSDQLSDYVIFSTIICPSDIPNRNGIAFPLEELVKFTDTPSPHMVYQGWRGCPLHSEHDNEDCTKAIGIIFDVSLMKMPEPYGQGRIHNVVGVCGIDKTKAPDIAQKFASGEIDTVSMGALADYFTCSICGAVIDQNHHCSHIKGTSADVNFEPVVDSFGNIHVAFLNAHNLAPIETSVVADPAWAPALSDMILQK